MKLTSSMFNLAFSAAIVTAQPALSQTATSQFNVQMTITSDCQVTSAGNLDFGSTGVISANRDSTSSIVVQCTSGTAYNLGLDEGHGSGATVASRVMTGPSSAKINYSLYTDAGRTTPWGNTINTNTMAASGNGSTQTYTVYGRVPPQTTPAAGTYTDTVTVTLTY
ncbi:spore coat protein U [Agrobacterium tumefaciens]|uniref:Spore coat protein U n=1 Tax=Agrobacterium tumefaciens TaxID=358 RepID=A0A0D0KRS5_AGRTU|nr:spore coat protein U [Agrobacterium tumefaciens]